MSAPARASYAAVAASAAAPAPPASPPPALDPYYLVKDSIQVSRGRPWRLHACARGCAARGEGEARGGGHTVGRVGCAPTARAQRNPGRCVAPAAWSAYEGCARLPRGAARPAARSGCPRGVWWVLWRPVRGERRVGRLRGAILTSATLLFALPARHAWRRRRWATPRASERGSSRTPSRGQRGRATQRHTRLL